jgi:hypothetical protein
LTDATEDLMRQTLPVSFIHTDIKLINTQLITCKSELTIVDYFIHEHAMCEKEIDEFLNKLYISEISQKFIEQRR